MTAILQLIDEAILFGLLAFVGQLLLMFLRSGSAIRVRLVPSPAQNVLLNYEICNVGDTIAEDVRLTFSRSAGSDGLWNTEEKQDLDFEVLAPGEAYTSMFCATPGWKDQKPVTATVSYKNGRLLRRLTDLDEQWWRRALDLVVWRPVRRKSFILDPTRLFAMRPNVGYPGKDEIRGIVDELGKMRRTQEQVERRRRFARMLGARPGKQVNADEETG